MTPKRVKVAGDLFHGQVPDGAVYVGRAAPGLPASRFRNPYPVRTHSLTESRRLFNTHLLANPELVEQARRELAGKDLACWCPLDAEWCHGDDWLIVVNGDVALCGHIVCSYVAEEGGYCCDPCRDAAAARKYVYQHADACPRVNWFFTLAGRRRLVKIERRRT